MLSRLVRSQRAFWVLSTVAFLLWARHPAASNPPKQQSQEPAGLALDVPVRPHTVVTPSVVMRSLTGTSQDNWRPTANQERARGLEELYASRAPSVVVVRTSVGHGSGFVVDGQGLVITNAHVIRDGLDVDVERGASFAHVHMGALGADGMMHVANEGLRAFVLKVDHEKDLALLKVEASPLQLKTLKAIPLAAEDPRPGMNCTIIGHPSSGMLWTIRSGQVAAVGTAPTDLIDVVMARLAAAPSGRAAVEAAIAEAPTFRMFLSTAGANPGDSGGPAMNAAGEAVGVTFAIPSDVGERRFTYHIHLGELRQFLASPPGAPIAVVPDPWDLGSQLGLADVTNDGRPDALVEMTRTGPKLLLDVDGDSRLPAGEISEEQFQALVRYKEWDFEVELDFSGQDARAFYDRDNDGTVDLVVEGERQKNNVTRRFELQNGSWRAIRPAGLLVDANYFRSPELARRFTRLMTAVSAAMSRQPQRER